jgi:hypothetical protein
MKEKLRLSNEEADLLHTIENLIEKKFKCLFQEESLIIEMQIVQKYYELSRFYEKESNKWKKEYNKDKKILDKARKKGEAIWY